MTRDNEYLVKQLQEKDEEIALLKRRLKNKTKALNWKKKQVDAYELFFIVVSLVIMIFTMGGIAVDRLQYIYDGWYQQNCLPLIGIAVVIFLIPHILYTIITIKEWVNEKLNQRNGRISKGKK